MKRLAPLLVFAGALLIAAGFWLLAGGDDTAGDPVAVVDALRGAQPATTTTAPAVSPEVAEPAPATEELTTQTSDSQVPLPVGIRIDALDVTAPITPYGVDASGQMAVPDNVTEVAWYEFGPKPGEPGSAVLAAHVDLAGSGPGVFFSLDSLDEEDRVIVAFDDGSETAFRVIARSVYDKNELPLDAIFSRQGPPVLTLITCGGDFNRNISRYDSNIVVYAVPLGDENPSGGSSL